jgi:hypothetical protein
VLRASGTLDLAAGKTRTLTGVDDDLLGTTLTDGDGRYRICFDNDNGTYGGPGGSGAHRYPWSRAHRRDQ